METKDFLKSRRIELGLSQLDIAKMVGVSEATVSRWESGNIANMKRDRIRKLAAALQVDPSALIFTDAPPPPDDILDKTLRRLLARATDEDKQMIIALLERMQEK